VKIVKQIEKYDGLGSFATIEDPEGNRIELWEPQDE
jgi:predicted enzyme related to lactoylglutathione lyase